MKFTVRKQTQWSWFNKLIKQETYGSALDIVVSYSTVIKDKLRKAADTSNIKSNTFYLSIKVDAEEFVKTYQGSVNRVLYAAEAKCNHVIGFGTDQIHFSEKDPVIRIQANGYEYFFIELS